MPDSVTCFLVEKNEAGQVTAGVAQRSVDDLPPGDVLIQVAWSSLNYKDALAIQGHPGVARRFPHVPGIDAAGTVIESRDPRFTPGQEVIVTSYELGAGQWGGYATHVRVPGDWVVPLPVGLTMRESMILGTAGFTAALALLRMTENRQTPELGPLAVTGATGGVGSLAVDIFSSAGYEVHAISGKPEHADYLRSLGAKEVLGREVLSTTRPMESARFGGGLDNVGGTMLASLLAQTAPYGNVASAGLASSPELHATVMPFIIRGVSLLGVASAGTARDIREEVWRRLASDWKPRHLDRICTREVNLHQLPEVFERMLAGGSLGRTLVTV